MIRNPNVTPIIPKFECLPFCVSGSSSSITTYIIAPAAKDNRYGNILVILLVSKSVIMAPIGSTIPERVPYKKLFHLDIFFSFNGIDTIAPSGKFWMAMPIEREYAAANVVNVFFDKKLANMTPTAIPSGILCNVTAIIIIIVFLNFEGVVFFIVSLFIK